MKRVNTLIDGLVMSRQFKASLPQVLVTSNHKLRVRVKYVEERLRKTSQNGVWNSCEATGRTRNTATRFCVLFDTDAQKKIGFRFGHPLAKPRSIDNFTGKEHLPFFIQIVSPFRSQYFWVFWNIAVEKHQLYLFESSRVWKSLQQRNSIYWSEQTYVDFWYVSRSVKLLKSKKGFDHIDRKSVV